MSIVRHKGQVMTQTRYMEIKQAEVVVAPQRNLSLMAKLNLCFFDVEVIALSDWLWFYGSMIFITAVALLTLLIVA